MAKNLTESIVMEKQNAQPCSLEVAFTVPQETVKAETARVLNYIGGVAQLPGFRPGRAPAALIRSKYAAEIDEELRNRFFAAAFDKISRDESIDLLNANFKELPDFKTGEECKFTFELTVAPEIEVGDYNHIKVDVPLDAVTDEEIEKRLDMFRSMYGGYAEVDGPAQADDMLKVSYTSDFELPEGASAVLRRQVTAEDTFIWLSEPEMIPGVIAALTGAEKGGEYHFAAAYPADYREAALAGKTVNYTVKVAAIQRRAKLSDEELVAKSGAESIEAFRQTIRQSCEMEHAARRREAAGEAVCKRLLETAGDFELPKPLLESEIQSELQRMARETVKSEEDAEKFMAGLDEHRKTAETAAAAKLRRTLVLRKIARLEKIAVESGELEAQMNSMSRHYGCTTKQLREIMEKNGAMEELKLDMANAKVIDKLVAAALEA